MKAYININQKAFMEIGKSKGIKVDLIDSAIFDWIKNFVLSQNAIKKLIDNKLFIWCSYSKIIDDNPLLNISSNDIIGRRLNKLIDMGILEKYLSKEDGNKIFLHITQFAYDYLLESRELPTQKSEPLPTQKSDNSILNNSNNIYVESEDSDKKKSSSKNKINYTDNFEIIWQEYDKKSGNKERAFKNYQKKYKNIDIKLMIEAIKEYKSSKEEWRDLKDFDGFLNGMIDIYLPKRAWVKDRDGNKHLGHFYDSKNLFISDEHSKLPLQSSNIADYIANKRFGYIGA